MAIYRAEGGAYGGGVGNMQEDMTKTVGYAKYVVPDI